MPKNPPPPPIGMRKGPYSLEKVYMSNVVLYSYPNGIVEVAKNRFSSENGNIEDTETVIKIFAKIIAHHKFRKTSNKLFKETLADQIEKAINKLVQGDYDDRSFQR